jgi:hypothetical protein
LEAHLKIYFPQIPHWFGDVDSPLVCALLERWPTLQALQKARPDTLRSFFRKHHCRKQDLIESRIKAIGEAMPALKDRAVVEAKVAVAKVLVQMIQVLHQGIEDLNRQIQEAAEAHPDFFIFVVEGLRPAKDYENRAVLVWAAVGAARSRESWIS